MSIWDDNFTGTNGDPPDSGKWEIIYNTDDAYKIESNTLALNYNTSPYAPENITVDIRGKFYLTGDFDIQISGTRYYISSSGTITWFTLEVVSEDETKWAGIGYFGGSTTPTYGFFSCDDTGSGTPHNRIDAYSDTDQFPVRITRSGSIITVYRWDSGNSRWEGDYNDTAGWTIRSISGNVRVRLAAYVASGKRAYWNLDNFAINSGDAEAIPESGITQDEIGLQSGIDGYNEIGQTPQGLGVQSAIDAESDYVFANFKVGFNAAADTSGNIQNVTVAGGLGANGIADAYLATESFFLNVGLKCTSDAAYQTKHVEDEIGLNALINCNREFTRDTEDEIGMNAGVDAYNFTTWAAANIGRARKFFILTLTGGPDGVADVEIPFSSFQARKRSDSQSYISVVIRKFDYASQITARQNGDIVVEAVYYVDGIESLRQEIIRAPIDTITLDEGPKNRSISLSGYKTVTYHSRSVTLQNAIYKRLSAGKLQYRFADVDLFLQPTDELTVGDDTFTVGNITYYVSENQRQMDVFQVEQ